MIARFRFASLLVLAAAGLPACQRADASAEKRPIPVKVRAVEKAPGAGPARYSGALEPLARVDMAFRVGGYVDLLGETDDGGRRRPLDKGDFVKKGTIVARVRQSDYAQKVATAKAAVNEARAQAKLADVELERSKRLFATNAITKAELDTSVARDESAKANVEGSIAQQGQAEIALDDTVLRAPMDGVVLSRQVEVGTLVSPGQPAIAIADTRQVKAVFGVPQALVEKLQVGAPLQIFVGAEGDPQTPATTIDAKVTRIAPSADSNGRVFSVEAALPNDAKNLRAGSVVSVHVPEATLARASIAVPLSAVVRSVDKPRGFSVFVLDGDGDKGVVHRRDVELGEVLGNSVTVVSGLELGQRVVTVGATLLRDGSEAAVIP